MIVTNCFDLMLVAESTANNLPLGHFKNWNPYAYGLFDECITAEAKDHGFRGKYCSVYLKPTLIKKRSDHSELSQSSPNVPLKGINWVLLYETLNWFESIIGKKIEPLVSEPGFYDPYMPGMGYCIPSSCSAEDFQKAVGQLVGSNALYVAGYELAIVASTSENHCFAEKEGPPDFDGPDIAVL